MYEQIAGATKHHSSMLSAVLTHNPFFLCQNYASCKTQHKSWHYLPALETADQLGVLSHYKSLSTILQVNLKQDYSSYILIKANT